MFKPLPTGGTAGITFNTNYTKLSAPPSGFAVINPSWQPSTTVGFEQPLLKNYGVDINQLLTTHPGNPILMGFPTKINPAASATPNAGILLTRINYSASQCDFRRSVNIMLFNVENLYWCIYANYFALYAAEQGLRRPT